MIFPPILYEDDSILAINKPSGLVMHAGVGTKETLADCILETRPSMREVGEPYQNSQGLLIPRPGIVHRLDKETSGVILLAKTQEAFLMLKKLFQKGKVTKEYHALVHGKPRKVRGTIRLAIGKSKHDFRKQTTYGARGKKREACTEYVLKKVCGDAASLLYFFPKTGRTHQIRVHAQSLSTPIIGDERYATGRKKILGVSRLALHAYRISFHPYYLESPLDIIAPYPDDLKAALAECKA